MQNSYLEKFIKDNIGKNHFQLIAALNAELERIEGINPKHQDPRIFSEHQLKEYHKYLMNFLYYLNTGGIPAGIGEEGLKVFTPIISEAYNLKNSEDE